MYQANEPPTGHHEQSQIVRSITATRQLNQAAKQEVKQAIQPRRRRLDLASKFSVIVLNTDIMA
mgnify:CR=1 FL=1